MTQEQWDCMPVVDMRRPGKAIIKLHGCDPIELTTEQYDLLRVRTLPERTKDHCLVFDVPVAADGRLYLNGILVEDGARYAVRATGLEKPKGDRRGN